MTFVWRFFASFALCLLPAAFLFTVWAEVEAPSIVPKIETFLQLLSRDEEETEKALQQIASLWENRYAAMILDLMRLELHKQARLGNRDSEEVLRRLAQLLRQQTKQWFGANLQLWREWTWTLDYKPHPDLARFKGMVYQQIDPRMRLFFRPDVPSLIRLDEVQWGGVRVNGIPPLHYPKHLPAPEADYLEDSHIVFGVVLNGEARAYPKRILAWHEMARDRLGGVELTLVYCTLCGSAIPYESEVGGQLRTFGTSGFLYRSNKLMFDEETRSLWSTLEGKPVIGELVNSGLRLQSHPIVTTGWKEWKSDHPDTTVLSLHTGYPRDYSEGAAYREYFSTDRLMFSVPKRDPRLKNKDEVLVIRLSSGAGKQQDRIPIAISVAFLEKHPVYQARLAGRHLVFVTSRKGANRVYDAGKHRFESHLSDGGLRDKQGQAWRVTEEALILEGEEETRVPRVPAHRAFWFGWYAQFPETKLIK